MVMQVYIKQDNKYIPVKILYTKDDIVCVQYTGDIAYYHLNKDTGYEMYKCCESFGNKTYISDIAYKVYEEIEMQERISHLDKEIEQNLLNQRKTDLVEESKVMLAEYLSLHPLLSDARGGEEAYYSVTQTKQQQMYDMYSRYQNMKRINPEAKLYWNATGEVSEEWNEDEFLLLMSQIEEYVRPFVIKQQELEVSINAAETFEEADSIDIHY